MMTGHCLCGKVTFELSAPPVMTLACHCKGCQRLTSSAYSVTSVVPKAAFRLTAGEVVIGALHGEVQHWFCDHCKSWIYTVPPGDAPVVNFRSTLIEPTSGTPPLVEMCTDEAFEWALIGARFQYPGFPPAEDFAMLAAAFAEQQSGS